VATIRPALPGAIIDLIRDGVHPANLNTGGDRAVFGALVRTAGSAQQRGWPYTDWAAVVTDRRSHLGTQAHLRRGRAERTRADYERQLRQAWDHAEKWLTHAPPALTHADIRTVIEKMRAIAEELDMLTADRAVLQFACDQADRYHTTRPALPRRAVMQETGLGERTVRNSLERLDRPRLGLLLLEIRGSPGGPSTVNRRAHCYRLNPAGAHIPVPEDRSVGPPEVPSDRSVGPPIASEHPS
jgi:hypothetical protein